MQETQVQSLKISPEEEMAALCSICDWEIHGHRSLAGYNPWGCPDLGPAQRRNHHAPPTTQQAVTGCSRPGKPAGHTSRKLPRPCQGVSTARRASLARSVWHPNKLSDNLILLPSALSYRNAPLIPCACLCVCVYMCNFAVHFYSFLFISYLFLKTSLLWTIFKVFTDFYNTASVLCFGFLAMRHVGS